MKKFLKGLLMGVVCSSLITYVINEKLINHTVYCECCGELFHNEYTIKSDICDICYGYNERRGHEQNGYLLNLDDHVYYFNGLSE